jgi:radical SAM superfamily enzyme YgiQ (UPF0313 family)
MKTIYLADLTHTGQIVASNVFPLGVGLVGSYIKQQFPLFHVQLFKYPTDLAKALEEKPPDLLGVSNYSWNCNLGMEYARRVKERWPQTVVIAGGPNYGLVDWEHREFWARYPFLDFYVQKEGELATVALLRALEAAEWHPERVSGVGGCHYLRDGIIHEPPMLQRAKNLDIFPSPYTDGLMDKFFDNVLIPLTHTTRGCPFKCSFCTEGTEYYDKVAKRTGLEADLDYIGPRVGTVQDLLISDANFGMFKEDVGKAQAIARSQDKYGWPNYIHVSGGKNHKERLLEVAEIVKGSMNVAASLQTTNQAVLRNVRRENISLEALASVGKLGTKIDANTYAELILNLPGDTREAHWQSIQDAVNAGLNFVKLYQLIMLPETDMNTPDTRAKFGMQTKFRVMPRCFGRYEFMGESFVSAEVEEVCVSQDSMSFEDYIECRELDLTVEIVHNASMYRELFGVCKLAGIGWFDFLMRFHNKRRDNDGLAALYDTFRSDTVSPLFPSRDVCCEFANSRIDDFIACKHGENELFKGKAVAFFKLQKEIHDALYSEMAQIIPAQAEYLDQLKRFSLLRKHDLLDTSQTFTETFDYDFDALAKTDFEADPDGFKTPTTITFAHTEEQQKAMAAYISQYGSDTLGIGRILMRAHLKRLFRTVTISDKAVILGKEKHYRRVANIYGD